MGKMEKHLHLLQNAFCARLLPKMESKITNTVPAAQSDSLEVANIEPATEKLCYFHLLS